MRTKTSIALLAGAVAAMSASWVTAAAAASPLGIYEQYASTDCSAASSCTLFFSAVPADTRISKVTCNFYVNAQNVSMTGVSFGDAPSRNAAKYQTAQYIGPLDYLDFSATFTQFQVVADTLHVVTKGRLPAVQIGYNVSATASLFCSIAGSTQALLPGAVGQ